LLFLYHFNLLHNTGELLLEGFDSCDEMGELLLEGEQG
jgi:hypothetical protein